MRGQDSVAEDRSLMVAVANRDETALRRLYDRHCGLLLHIAFSTLRSWEAAEEVVQDVFVRCWQRANTYDETRGSPTAWLVAMTRSRTIDYLREASTARRGGRPVSLDSVGEYAAPAAAGPGARVEVGPVARGLRELPAEMRTAILLASYGGLRQREIADVMETPVGTVKSWIRRGLLRLRESVEQERM